MHDYGSIPAHTGERTNTENLFRIIEVYPRTYGGTDWMPATAMSVAGLSPHIRGNVRAQKLHVRLDGSIPAHTGERPVQCLAGRLARVYPRTYGGTLEPDTVRRGGSGLSPHIRGNGASSHSTTFQIRSIPAHTGERWITTLICPSPRVYPRTYGGTPGRT